MVFDNIYKKLEKELHEKKKQMAHVIELSNMTYEQRDNCQMEITAIDQANRKEQEDFEEQMIELGRMLEQVRRENQVLPCYTISNEAHFARPPPPTGLQAAIIQIHVGPQVHWQNANQDHQEKGGGNQGEDRRPNVHGARPEL